MTIEIVAPSGVIDPQHITSAAAFLQQQGFIVNVAHHAFGSYGRFSGTAKERLADLNAALGNPQNDIILCARGGYGLSQIIDKVIVPDKHCPLLVGFSDITALHNLLGHKNIPSLHAVMCKHIAEYAEHRQSVDLLLGCLKGLFPAYSIPPHQLNISGEARGTLRGGNLSVICSLQGTPFATNIGKGDILFIEDVGEHPYAIDRMMNNLRLSGVLSHLGGLIVGQFSDYEEDPRMPFTVYEGIQKMVADYGYPVLFNFPAGHVSDNRPLLLNAPCCLSVSEAGGNLEFKV